MTQTHTVKFGVLFFPVFFHTLSRNCLIPPPEKPAKSLNELMIAVSCTSNEPSSRCEVILAAQNPRPSHGRRRRLVEKIACFGALWLGDITP